MRDVTKKYDEQAFAATFVRLHVGLLTLGPYSETN